MAYMSQEKKKQIHAELKKVIPATWKWSLAVRHHSTIVLTIAAADINILAELQEHNNRVAEQRGNEPYKVGAYCDLNPYHYDKMLSDSTLAIFEPIFVALNDGNHDNSDPMTDYYDVGWYVDVNIGRWNKPFHYLAPMAKAA